MATIARVNPASTGGADPSFENIGKDVTIFTLDTQVAVNGSPGPEGAQQAILEVINKMHVILMTGPLGNSNTEQTFMTEGADSVVVATLQADIRTLGTHDSVDVSAATVTAKTLVIAV